MPSPWPRSHGNSHGQSGMWRHWRMLLGAITMMLLLVGWYAQQPQPLEAPLGRQPQRLTDGGATQQQQQQQLQALELDRTAVGAAIESPDATAGVVGASAGGVSPLSAALRSSIRLAPVQLWATRSHCGGARLSLGAEQRLRHGYPLKRRTVQLTAGDSYAVESPPAALLHLAPDSHGQIHVPYVRVEDAASAALATGVALPTDAAAFTALTGALPAGRGSSSTFCLTDPAALHEERQRVEQHKQAALAGHPDPYLRIDYECMSRRWRRCLLVLRLDNPDSLAWEATPQPWHSGMRDRKGRGPGRGGGGRGGGRGRGRGSGRNARPSSFSPSSADSAQTDEPEGANDDEQIQLANEQAAGVGSDSTFGSDSASVDGAASPASPASPSPSVIGVVRIHEACRGRGECERWPGPLPK